MSSGLDDRERTSILAGLESCDEEIRRLAVEQLAVLPPSEAIPHLIKVLADSSWRVRKAGVERLVACNESSLVHEALINALADGDNPGRRNSAVEALVSCGQAVVPRLIEALSSDDVDVRKMLVDTFAGIGGGEGRDAMIATLEDPDPNVRAAAADALGAIAGAGVADSLRACAVDDEEDQLVRFSALRALVNLEESIPVAQLAGVLADPVLSTAGYSLLGYLADDSGVDSLLKGLVSSSRSGCEAAMEALLRTLANHDGEEAEALVVRIREAAMASPELIDRSIARLPEASLATRLVLVQLLGLVGTPKCVIAILIAGRDEAIFEVAQSTLESLASVAESAIAAAWDELDSDLQRDACRVLGNMDGEAGAGRLLATLDSPHTELRAVAARSLGRRRCPEALPGLMRRLEIAAPEEDYEVEEERDALVAALIDLASPGFDQDTSLVGEVIEHLASRLAGSDEKVRLAIASVLGRIGRQEEAEIVTSLLKDTSSRVRRAAVEALARLDPGSGSEPLRLALADESALVRCAAAGALSASRAKNVIDDLERLMGDHDWRVRAATMRSVGAHFSRFSDPDARDAALDLVERGLSDEAAVCLAAVEALSLIGGARAADMAVTLLAQSEPELSQAAVNCIGMHGETEHLLELLPLVSHENWAVRAEAIQTLALRLVPQALPPILRRLETEQDAFVRDAILHGLKRLEA